MPGRGGPPAGALAVGGPPDPERHHRRLTAFRPNDKLTLLVMYAFPVEKKSNIDRDRVLGLKKLAVKDAQWRKAMDIIFDSVVIGRDRAYVRFACKDEKGFGKPPRWMSRPVDRRNALFGRRPGLASGT